MKENVLFRQFLFSTFGYGVKIWLVISANSARMFVVWKECRASISENWRCSVRAWCPVVPAHIYRYIPRCSMCGAVAIPESGSRCEICQNVWWNRQLFFSLFLDNRDERWGVPVSFSTVAQLVHPGCPNCLWQEQALFVWAIASALNVCHRSISDLSKCGIGIADISSCIVLTWPRDHARRQLQLL